jgi:hypothetical protein
MHTPEWPLPKYCMQTQDLLSCYQRAASRLALRRRGHYNRPERGLGEAPAAASSIVPHFP